MCSTITETRSNSKKTNRLNFFFFSFLVGCRKKKFTRNLVAYSKNKEKKRGDPITKYLVNQHFGLSRYRFKCFPNINLKKRAFMLQFDCYAYIHIYKVQIKHIPFKADINITRDNDYVIAMAKPIPCLLHSMLRAFFSVLSVRFYLTSHFYVLRFFISFRLFGKNKKYCVYTFCNHL